MFNSLKNRHKYFVRNYNLQDNESLNKLKVEEKKITNGKCIFLGIAQGEFSENRMQENYFIFLSEKCQSGSLLDNVILVKLDDKNTEKIKLSAYNPDSKINYLLGAKVYDVNDIIFCGNAFERCREIEQILKKYMNINAGLDEQKLLSFIKNNVYAFLYLLVEKKIAHLQGWEKDIFMQNFSKDVKKLPLGKLLDKWENNTYIKADTQKEI